MPILKRILEIIGIKEKNVKIETTEIVGFNTKEADIPEYSELSEEEKKKVNEYIRKIENGRKKDVDTGSKKSRYMQRFENLLYYIRGDSDIITDLLVKLLNKTAIELSVENLKEKTYEEIIKTKIESQIAIEKIKRYENGLYSLNEKTKLKAIALEEMYKKSEGNFLRRMFLNIREEKANKEYEKARYEEAIERVRIEKMRIEQQIEGVTRTEINIESTIESIKKVIEGYNEVLNEDSDDEIANNILDKKEKELRKMMNTINIKVTESAKEQNESARIKRIAGIEARIELFAASKYKDEIDIIEKELNELSTVEMTESNKEKLLAQIEKLEVKCKIFKKYLKESDIENLYELKFETWMSDLYTREKTPIKKDELSEEEVEYYKKIIDKKISLIVQGKNRELENHFEKRNLSKAVRVITDELRNTRGKFDVEEILLNDNKLRILLAFDKKSNFEKLKVNTDDVLEFKSPRTLEKHVCNVGMKKTIGRIIEIAPFGLDNNIPIQTLIIFRQKDNEYKQYRHWLMSKNNSNFYLKISELHKKIESEEGVHKIPEGISWVRR